jgi:hypothetical protein
MSRVMRRSADLISEDDLLLKLRAAAIRVQMLRLRLRIQDLGSAEDEHAQEFNCLDSQDGLDEEPLSLEAVRSIRRVRQHLIDKLLAVESSKRWPSLPHTN